MQENTRISKREFIRLLGSGLAGFCCLSSLPLSSAPVFLSSSPSRDKDLWQWSCEARHYIASPRGMRCLLCPNECTIEEGDTGDCRTRVAKDGKLYSIAYGNPCAVHIDPIEKKPLFHFLPSSKAFSVATAGCNLACLNCQNWSISQSSPLETRNYDLMPEKLVEQALSYKCQSIAYTYSDPVAFYEYCCDTCRLAQEQGLKNLMISAGYINQQPLKELLKNMDAANIDLKSFSDEIYMMLNAGKLEPVLNTLKTIKDAGVWLEITNLIVPEWTDDLDMIRKMCAWLASNGFDEYPLHFSRFHPSYKLSKLAATPVSVLNAAREIAVSEGMKYVYIGNVPAGNHENTFCPECHKMILERKGFRIVQNNIQDGKCAYCGAVIKGVWE